jgi:hypothetical protein
VYFLPAGAGTDEYRIWIIDKGAPCSLRDRPTSLVGSDAAGQLTVLHPVALAGGDAAAMTNTRPANLSPTQAGEVVLVTSIGCPAGQRAPSPQEMYTSLRLGVGREVIRVPFGGGPEPVDHDILLPCGVAMSGFFAAF